MLENFTNTYTEARERFAYTAKRSGYTLKSFPLLTSGPHNEVLSVDIAYHLPGKVRKIVMSCSGTHGVEGFYGSAVQTAWLNQNTISSLPEQIGILFIHALNPYGFAGARRVNEDNIDINRNFVDFAKSLPCNEGYAQFAELLLPREWFGEEKQRADAALLAARTENETFYLSSIYSGQYSHPHGLFWGGDKPAWSNIVLKAILDEFLRFAHEVVFIDLHTGYGDYKQVEVYSLTSEESANHQRLQSWYKDTVRVIASPYLVLGSVANAVADHLANKQVTRFAIECGTTHLPLTTLDALRADHWLHESGDLSAAYAATIRKEMKQAFYPDDADWKKYVLQISLQVFDETLQNLKISG